MIELKLREKIMINEFKLARCGCGGEAKVASYHGDGYESFYVYCQNCNTDSDYYETETEAIEAWNKAMGVRTAKVKNIAYIRGYPPEGECSNCGYDVVDDGEYCPSCGARLEWE